MKLYHGTSAQNARKILQSGLQPRKKRTGNWRKTILSHPNGVYLTDAYALYFALVAAKQGMAAIIELESSRLNPFRMAPDEDVLAQINGSNRVRGDEPLNWESMNLFERTKFFRDHLNDYAGTDSWKASLKAMGTCCHMGSINTNAITRIAFIDTNEARQTSTFALDPMISIMNYKLVGHRYRALTKWVFGDPLGMDVPEKVRFANPDGTVSQLEDFKLPDEMERRFITIEEFE